MDSSLINLNEIDDFEIASAVNCDIEELASHLTLKDNDLKILCQNIRSVYANLDDLNLNISTLNTSPDIIILTECRLNLDKLTPTLNNYISCSTIHNLNQNDGVVTYIKNDVIVTDLREIRLDHASCIQIETYGTVILAIYRSPSNNDAGPFLNSLNLHLETLKSYKNIVVTGDINIHLIRHENEKPHVRDNRLSYLNMLSMHGIMPGHQFPTRYGSCLDHFMLKIQTGTMSAQIAVLNTSITDDSMIFLNLSDQTATKECKKIKTVIDFNNALLTLAKKNLSEILLCNDPDSVVKQLINKITESLIENTRIVRITKLKRVLKPWITPGILRCIRNRNKMQKKLRTDPQNEISRISYKRYRNYCNNLIKKLKRRYSYQREQLANSTKNSKNLWKSIKSIANLNKRKTDNLKLLNIRPSPAETVNHVNNYFVGIGRDLAENIISNSSLSTKVKSPTDMPEVPWLGQYNHTFFKIGLFRGGTGCYSPN